MIQFAAITDKGKTRKTNEDYFLAQKGLFIVADGMGGHKAGDVASRLAVTTVNKLNRTSKPDAKKEKLIGSFFKQANKAVKERALRISTEAGMGTTMTLMLTDSSKAYIGHIGDSRAYLLRENDLKQLTTDHSLVADMIQEGQITEEEARSHPYRNVITKALGSESSINPDIFSVDLLTGDRVLLCSDGLTSMVADDDIKVILSNRTESLKTVCNRLVKKANEGGGADNITAIVIDVVEGKKRNKAYIKTALLVLVFFLALLSSALAGRAVIDNSYYVGFSGDYVGVYRGLPYEIGSWRLSKTIYISQVKKQNLPKFWQQRIEKTISVEGLLEGKRSIEEIDKENVPKKP